MYGGDKNSNESVNGASDSSIHSDHHELSPPSSNNTSKKSREPLTRKLRAKSAQTVNYIDESGKLNMFFLNIPFISPQRISGNYL